MTHILLKEENRGRPKGTKNGERMLMPWRPLTWKPAYENIIALFCVGFTHKEIADRCEYSAVQVGNIVRSPEGQRIIAEYKDNVRTASTANEVKSLHDIKAKAIERVSNIILDDTLAKDHPFRVAEFSVSILKGLGSLNDPSAGVTNNQTNIVIGNDIAQKLVDGLARANEARLLNSSSASAPAPSIEVVISPIVE